MRLQGFINERDIAKLPVEDCKDFKGEDLVKCKVEKYQDYIRELEDAIKTSESDDEEERLKTSLEDAKKVLFNLRTKEKEMRQR